MLSRAVEYLEPYRPAKDGIDVDGLLAAIRPQIGEGGMAVELPVLGELTIYPSDVDTLAQYIREA